MNFWRLSVLSTVLLGACSAHVSHRVNVDDAKASGIRYYNSAPYLLVYSDGKNGLNWQIIYLPDQTRIMTAAPEISGARVEMAMNFSNGVLNSAATSGDSTAVPKALLAAVQTALPLIAAAAGSAKPGFPAPQLYRLVATGSTLTFKGGPGDTAIQVPIFTGAAQ